MSAMIRPYGGGEQENAGPHESGESREGNSMQLPTPFIVRSGVLPSSPIPLIVVGYPAPDLENPKVIQEHRIVLGLGRGRDARVASVAAAFFYNDPVSFRDLRCLASHGGKLHVFHSIEGDDYDARVEKLRESARTAIGRGLIGDVWGVEVYDYFAGTVDGSVNEEDGVIPAKKHPGWVYELARGVDAALTLFAGHIEPWPKDAWILSGGTP